VSKQWSSRRPSFLAESLCDFCPGLMSGHLCLLDGRLGHKAKSTMPFACYSSGASSGIFRESIGHFRPGGESSCFLMVSTFWLRPYFLLVAGRLPRPATVSREAKSMDYIGAGIAALFLFGYLIYALLRPERF
jgi:K+-transporting ATPase KdpF subunit